MAPREGIPVMRLYNKNSGEHFYTKEETEWKYLATLGLNVEGTAFFSKTEEI